MLTQQPVAASLLSRFRSVRAATMDFCAPLTPEDMMVQSCAEASPVKWHLAHTSWFFETFVLREFVAGYQPFHPEFTGSSIAYYKSLGEMPEKKLRASFSRPPLDEILAYRKHVDAAIGRLLEQTPEDEALRRIALGLEHEQQHLELAATDIKHALFTNPLHPAYLPSESQSTEQMAPPLEWRSFYPGYPGRPGVVDVGITPDEASIESFAFDNETPRHSCLHSAVPPGFAPHYCRRIPRIHRRRRLHAPPSSGSPKAGTLSASTAGRHRSTGSRMPT